MQRRRQAASWPLQKRRATELTHVLGLDAQDMVHRKSPIRIPAVEWENPAFVSRPAFIRRANNTFSRCIEGQSADLPPSMLVVLVKTES